MSSWLPRPPVPVASERNRVQIHVTQNYRAMTASVRSASARRQHYNPVQDSCRSHRRPAFPAIRQTS